MKPCWWAYSTLSVTRRIVSAASRGVSGFSAAFSVDGNMPKSGDFGYLLEGMVNVPLGDRAAVRLVGYSAGFQLEYSATNFNLKFIYLLCHLVLFFVDSSLELISDDLPD